MRIQKAESDKMGSEKMEKEFLTHVLSAIEISLTEQQLAQFTKYREELLSWNNKFNLTAITEEKMIIIKHFYDSALGLKAWNWQGHEKVLDLGTGAGFPGIPLKIICPEIQVTLVDSLQKRVRFLQHIIATLPLTQTEALHGRAEELGQNKMYREKFDIVVSRAVASLPVLVEYCLPFVKTGGVFLAYKGPEGEEESRTGVKAIAALGGKVIRTESFLLPEELSKRMIIIIKKVKPTPAGYPRKPGMPAKKPL